MAILVVDDEERILNVLRSKLRASGYEIHTAADRREGPDQANGQDPDLIELDLLLPRIDGLEMPREVRAFSGVSVIILTAKGEGADRTGDLSLGADGYLPKRFHPDGAMSAVIEDNHRKREVDSWFRIGQGRLFRRRHGFLEPAEPWDRCPQCSAGSVG